MQPVKLPVPRRQFAVLVHGKKATLVEISANQLQVSQIFVLRKQAEHCHNTVQPVMSIFIDLWNVDCGIRIMNEKVEKLMHAVHCHIETLSYVLLSY